MLSITDTFFKCSVYGHHIEALNSHQNSLTCSGVHLVKEKSSKDGQIGLSSSVFRWPGRIKKVWFNGLTMSNDCNLQHMQKHLGSEYWILLSEPKSKLSCNLEQSVMCKADLPVNGEAGTFWWGTCTGGGCVFSKVICEGKRSSQRLSSLKSTERNTPAVLFSSKEAAMRWNMGSTCTKNALGQVFLYVLTPHALWGPHNINQLV